MRIAQVAPLMVRVPPVRYGGTERVIHTLTEGLVRRGHEVTLFAAGGSSTSARLHATSPRPLWEMGLEDTLPYRKLQVEELLAASGRFDVIHSHIDHLAWAVADQIQAPLVTTLHGPLDLPELRPIFAAHPEQPLVSISDSQRNGLAGLPLNWAATVHHGLDLDAIPSGEGDGGYLLFLGRISPEKGPVTAIRIAIEVDLPIKIAARINPDDRAYYLAEVRPLLDHPRVEWLGEQDDDEKAFLLGRARALLMPIEWDEPFGLAVIEALAAGTPVISRPRGSLPELIRHGEHGFLVHAEAEFVEACRQLDQIDRSACRAWALQRFSAERMVADYERVYRRLIARHELAATRPIAVAPPSDRETHAGSKRP